MKKNVLYLLCIIFLFSLIFVLSATPLLADSSIIPPPQDMVLKGFNVTLDSSWSIVVDTLKSEDMFTAEELQKNLQENYNLYLPVIDASSAGAGSSYIIIGNPHENAYVSGIASQMDISLPADFDSEGYMVDMTKDTILIVGTNSHGLFYGMQTLLQLFREENSFVILTGVKITDWPDIKIRGVDLCGAGYFSNIFDQIDELACLKLNMVVLENNYNYDLANSTTRTHVEDIFQYARERHIEPLPRLETWGVSAKNPNCYSGMWIKDEKMRCVGSQLESIFKSPDLNFFLRCESRNEITARNAVISETGTGQISFESSQAFDYGNGVYLNGSNINKEQILIPRESFNSTEGTIEFWFKPKWNYNDGKNHFFLGTTWEENQISLAKLDNNYLYWSIQRNGVFHRLCSTDTCKWNADEWHHLAVTWGPAGSEMYLDGQPIRPLLFRDDVYTGDISFPSDYVTVGSEDWGVSPADAVFDEIHVWNTQRKPYEDVLLDGDLAVNNSSFENDDNSDSRPDEWMLGDYWSWDSQGYNSNRCVKVSIPGTNDMDSGWMASDQIFDAAPETWYNLRFWGKILNIGGTHSPAIRIRELDENEVQLLNDEGAWLQHHSAMVAWTGWGNFWKKGEMNFKTDPRCRKLHIYANICQGYGTAWFDDIKLTQLNGSLLNVIRTETTDIEVTNTAKTQTYTQGTDYEIIAGAINNWYSVDNRRTVVRCLSGSQIAERQEILVSYDMGSLMYLDSFAAIPYCYSEPGVYEILYSAIDDFLDNPLLKPRYMQIGHYSEIRGINRDSRDLKRDKTNADLLSEDLNKIDKYIKSKDSSVRLMIWDDMLNPWHNGDIEDYQVPFGGIPGKMSPAIDTIPKDIVMNCWWYDMSDDYLCDPPHDFPCKMKYSPDFFHSRGFQWLATAWKDKINIDNWVDIAMNHEDCLGIMGSSWLDGGGWEGSLEGIRYIAQKTWAGNPQTIAAPSAIWSMDEGTDSMIYDATENNNDGTLHEATWTNGVSGTALDFNTNKYVQVADSASLDLTNAMTISCWVKADSWASQNVYAEIVRKFVGGSSGSGYILCRENLTNRWMILVVTTDGGQLVCTPELSAGQWYHIAATFDGTSLKIYRNGTLDGQVTFAQSTILTNNEPLTIGGHGDPDYGALDGQIDEVKIFKRALSASEIQAEYEANKP